MRKILLATTALVAFAGAAQAAESPIQVTVGGYVDFRAALFQEAEKTTDQRREGDFGTKYRLNFAADGKAAGGIEYGAKLVLANTVGNGENVYADQAYVYMSGAWGKILMGDEQGASDLFVYAPTVGVGQINGDYDDFTDTVTLAEFQPFFIDDAEDNTKVTYYTPKVGNAEHKLQLGISYTPNPEQGRDVVYYDQNAYKDQVEAAIQYTGTIENVNLVVAPFLMTGNSDDTATLRDYTMWGVGAQASYAGFTLGGSYIDGDDYNTIVGQDKDQDIWTIGLKYEFDKVALAVNYLDGKGYDNLRAVDGGAQAVRYVDEYNAIGFGATYTWFPGLTTAADAVFFDQSIDGIAHDNEGHVLMLSQKMTF